MPEKISMGQKLAQAHADKGKILFHTAIRLTLAGIIVLAGIRSNPPGRPVSFAAGLLAALIALSALIWVFFPFIHLRDCLEFYERGIVIGTVLDTGEAGRNFFYGCKKQLFSVWADLYVYRGKAV